MVGGIDLWNCAGAIRPIGDLGGIRFRALACEAAVGDGSCVAGLVRIRNRIRRVYRRAVFGKAKDFQHHGVCAALPVGRAGAVVDCTLDSRMAPLRLVSANHRRRSRSSTIQYVRSAHDAACGCHSVGAGSLAIERLRRRIRSIGDCFGLPSGRERPRFSALHVHRFPLSNLVQRLFGDRHLFHWSQSGDEHGSVGSFWRSGARFGAD